MGVNRVEPETKPRYTEDGQGAQMGFFQHLDELRMRVTRAFIGVIIGTAIGALVAEPVLAYLGGPYLNLQEGNEFLIFDPTGTVVAYFRVALLIGATLAVPIVTYQSVMFIVPAMTARERRFFMMALPAIFLLFLIGVAFAWFVMIPPALRFLEGFQDQLFDTRWEASRYIQFVTSLLFWMGVGLRDTAGTVCYFAARLITAGPLLRSWRLAIVISAVALQ